MIDELNDAELDLVSGGLQDGYQFCPNGPAGTGVYPSYVNCDGLTNRQVYGAFFDGFNKTSGQPPV
ncbi:hypothetical protein [Bradyrhizobium sp. NAS96.2]|uniref:hypothetical protein n=1 Tax=Bradyrhizobium sp. NAS96.2 TaxID=1680160 RepID=UPI00093D103C|nr:hypothetical protein [Bradyrhizobium sp. NAS96.2]OKO71622.1 hypothetical protein AC628_28000 [Bradyrhizobium sp. NAS96.2]